MRKVLALGVAAAALTLAIATAATAGNGTPINQGSANTLTLAVYGDAPYAPNNTDTSANSQCIIETGQPDTSTKPCTDNAHGQHPGYNVPNFHRIIVHGGTTFPAQPLE